MQNTIPPIICKFRSNKCKFLKNLSDSCVDDVDFVADGDCDDVHHVRDAYGDHAAAGRLYSLADMDILVAG
jgi:hypothetical protein